MAQVMYEIQNRMKANKFGKDTMTRLEGLFTRQLVCSISSWHFGVNRLNEE